MQNQSGGLVAQPAANITNHGGIVEMTVPDGFTQVKLPPHQQMHNHVDFKMSGSSTARICYEETVEPLYDEDAAEMEQLFSETLPEGTSVRQLNIYGDAESGPDDSAAYGALCGCFVFGGALVRDGSIIDMDQSIWELRRLGQRNVISAQLKFMSSTGSPSKREALVVIPAAPGEGGSAYIWLEGTNQEVAKHQDDFLNAIANGQFQKLKPQV